MASIFNVSGTTQSKFKIGKNGCTIESIIVDATNKYFKIVDNISVPKLLLESNGTSYIDKDNYTGTSAIAKKLKQNFGVTGTDGAKVETATSTNGENNIVIKLSNIDSTKLINNIAWGRVSSLGGTGSTNFALGNHNHNSSYVPFGKIIKSSTDSEITITNYSIVNASDISLKLNFVTGSILTNYLADLAVTTGKLANDSVTVDKISLGDYSTKITNVASANNVSTNIAGKSISSIFEFSNNTNTGKVKTATLSDKATGDKNGKDISTYVSDITGSNATITVSKGNSTSSTITINNVARSTSSGSADTATKVGNTLTINYLNDTNNTNSTKTFNGSASVTIDLNAENIIGLDSFLKNNKTLNYKGTIAFSADNLVKYTPSGTSGDLWKISIPSTVTSDCKINNTTIVYNDAFILCISTTEACTTDTISTINPNWSLFNNISESKLVHTSGDEDISGIKTVKGSIVGTKYSLTSTSINISGEINPTGDLSKSQDIAYGYPCLFKTGNLMSNNVWTRSLKYKTTAMTDALSWDLPLTKSGTIALTSDIIDSYNKTESNERYIDLTTDQTVTGTKKFNKGVIITGNVAATRNANIELGAIDNGDATTPHIDFHTDAKSTTDYNVRLLATGEILKIYGTFAPCLSNTYSLGASDLKFKDFYLSGKLTDGTNNVLISNIVTKDTVQTITGKKTFSDTIIVGRTDTTEENNNIVNGHLIINPSYIKAGTANYNDGIRINTAANNWSEIVLGGEANSTGGNTGVWIVGKRGAAEVTDNVYSGKIGDFYIGYQSAAGGLNLHTDGTAPTWNKKSVILSDDSRLIDSRNAKDVSSWAKASTKPTYAFSEITNKPTTLSGYGITDVYNKTEVNDLFSSVYRVKGSVDSYDLLPSANRKSGDVYNVVNAFEITETEEDNNSVSVGKYHAGTNFVWNGTNWDSLGGSIDLSNYYTKNEVLPLTGGTLTGDLNFASNNNITWNGEAVRQKIKITDDSTSDTPVFTFQQSTNSGKSYDDLLTIKDDGSLIIKNQIVINDGDPTYHVRMSADADHQLFIHTATKTIKVNNTIDSSTTNSYIFPDKDGTFALTSDITDLETKYLDKTGGTLTGDLKFTATASTGTSKGIYWSGSTDGAAIYYTVPTADQGNLVFKLTDDANTKIYMNWNGTNIYEFNQSWMYGPEIQTKKLTLINSEDNSKTINLISGSSGELKLNGVNYLDIYKSKTTTNGMVRLDFTPLDTTKTWITVNCPAKSGTLALISDIPTSLPANGGTADSATNADTLDGNHAAAFASASHTHLKNDITDLTLASTTVTGLVLVSSVFSTNPTINNLSSTSGRYYGISRLTDGKLTVNVPWTDTHYSSNLYSNTSGTKSNSTVDVSNPFLILSENNSVKNNQQLLGSNGISIIAKNGVISFKHSNSITAGTISESGSARTLGFGGKFKIPSIAYDAQGHIISTTTTELTMPATPANTLNTVGSTNSDSKLYLVGTTSQVSSAQSYSNANVSATNGVITSSGYKAGNCTMQYNASEECMEFIFE